MDLILADGTRGTGSRSQHQMLEKEEDKLMNTKEKNIALQCLKDAQQAIESLEEEWTKASKAGQPTEELDQQFDKLLAKRRGIETLMIDLGIKFDRKDYRHTDLNGNTSVHTLFYLV